MENGFGKYLEELRGKMSLREASKKSDVSHTYIRDLELGKKTDPSKETLLKLANAYGVRYDDLLYRSTKLDNLDIVNAEAQKYFLKEIEDVLEEMCIDNTFFDFLKDDIKKLEEKHNNILDIDEKLTPDWLKTLATNARYDSEFIYDLIKDLKEISKKFNLHKDIRALLSKKGVTYNGHQVTEQDKQLIRSYLDALFSNR
ncbi:helix-turn-helix domain-containing protein [Cytobacillus sp. Hz8]|uniref:helix-turn-helix domain-containing protein n=1 Tax=Cytobacillus sp. Hz8 TaxID=3347168 RepID=UPI0035DF5CBF